MNDKINQEINEAVEQFRSILLEQYERNASIAKGSQQKVAAKDVITIGLIPGDGIGPVIMDATKQVLERLLSDELDHERIELRTIDGMTLENRLATGETVPAAVMDQLLQCDVILKGPTTTPSASMSTNSKGANAKNTNLESANAKNTNAKNTNLESANVYLRRTLDLYANVRPVRLPQEGIDWTFFRENTEGEYALGSRGVRIGDDLSVDFKVTTREGTRRIARAAYEYARANGKTRVSIVTKANIMKKTDGDFQTICKEVAADYPEIETDTWFIDIMAANLVNRDIRNQFQVFVLPNLYGDIITDEAAQIQGGVGTAGSANIGNDYAIFEAVHGSAPRMVEQGIAHLANPASLMTAAAMMLRHLSSKTSSIKTSSSKSEVTGASMYSSKSEVTGASMYSSKSEVAGAAMSSALVNAADRLENAIKQATAELGPGMTGLPGGTSCETYTEYVLSRL